MAGLYNMAIKQGTTFEKGFRWTRNVEPIILEGCSIVLSFKSNNGSQAVYSTTTGEVTITDPLQGRFKIKLSATITNGFNWTTTPYNINIQFPNGDIRRFLEGNLNLSKKA